MVGVGLGVLNVQQGLVDDGGAGLPDGAIAYADFKNGTYYYGGNSLSDFFTENTDYGSFDLARVESGVGLTDDGTETAYPVLAPALTAELLVSGYTVQLTWVSGGVNPDIQMETLNLPDYAPELTAHAQDNTVSTMLDWINPSTTLSPDVASSGPHRAAYTFEQGNFAGSLDGGAFQTIAVDMTGANSIGFGVVNDTALEKIVFWPVKANTELAALSAL